MIEAKHVCVRRGGQAILDDVSLSLAAGETMAIVGPNGAGKSTLLHVLSGELQPDSGGVSLDGQRIGHFGSQALALRRAVLAQQVQVTFPFTVDEIVRMGAGQRRGGFVDGEVDVAMGETETAHLRSRIITTLSGGEQQRVHIARILVQVACGRQSGDAGFMLLDEPTSSLDLRHQIDLINIAKRCAAQGVGVIAVLHDLNLAVQFAGRILVMERGRIVAQGDGRETITEDVIDRVFRIKGAVRRGILDVPVVLPSLTS